MRLLPTRGRKLAALGVLLLGVALVGQGTAIVWNARARTPRLVASVLESAAIQVRASDLTPWQRRALLAVEDPGFLDHRGVDLTTPGGGLTTISQGVVKWLYFERFRPGLAKLRQTLIARFAFDPLVPKEDQLTLFLNLVYLGDVDGTSVRGFAAAASAYYDKPLGELEQDEFLSLVAMVIRPQHFHPRRFPERNADRVSAITRLISGQYEPAGLMDLYYGGHSFRPSAGRLRDWWARTVWGY